jgi:membrane-associated phospholipid phosphatase
VPLLLFGRHVRIAAAIALLGIAPARAEAQAAAPAPSTIKRITTTIADDVKSIASVDTFPLGLAAAAFAMSIWPYDAQITHHAASSQAWKDTFEGWARIGGQEWFLATTAIGTYAYGRIFDRPGFVAVGGDLIEAESIAGVSTLLVKVGVHRTRPDGEARSFPSGHAAGTFAAATVLQRHFGWKVGVPAYTGASLVSVARLQANSHYPTDIIIGAAIGILSGRAGTFDLAAHRVRLSPSLTRGAIGITGSIQ